ncbi:MAG TPA: hypothetical protein VIH59_22740 [Candidatus Tectomicrobia bacterium]|jgi:hypothetical protein
MEESIHVTLEAIQEAWSSIEAALAEAMERYDFPIPPNVRPAVRATFSVSTLVKSGILTPEEGKLFHDIRAFKDGKTAWAGDCDVIDFAWLLAEYIREA